MELKIQITKANKEKIIQFINTFLEDDSIEVTNMSCDSVTKEKTSNNTNTLLSVPPNIQGLEESKIENWYGNIIGSWGQFNSFFPIKAATRILANTLVKENIKGTNLKEFIDKSIITFEQTKIFGKSLNTYRGFPSSDKDSAKGRYAWHFLITAEQMGLIKVIKTSLKDCFIPISANDWNKVDITLTKAGLEFAKLKNNLFDGLKDDQTLTEEEKAWIVNYLKKIDREGYKEYSFLLAISKFLKEGHNGKEDLWNWLKNNEKFVKYIKEWSRKSKSGDEKLFRKQIENLARTFAGSKNALLRELKVMEDKRNDYTIISEL